LDTPTEAFRSVWLILSYYMARILVFPQRDKFRMPEMIGRRPFGILDDVICGKYVEGRGIDLFNEVCQRNLEGVVAKRKGGEWFELDASDLTAFKRRTFL